MPNWTSLSSHTPPFPRHALAGALALALLHGAAQAAPTDPLGPAVKLNVGPPETIASLDVELNNAGAGVVLWQEKQDDGRYASYFRRFDRMGNLAPLQTYSVTDTLLPITLLKVFDNGEFAVENRSGNQVKITIRNKNGGFARKLWAINCKAANCQVAMDGAGRVAVADIATVNGQRHPVAQLRDAQGKVTKPWFVADQSAAGVTGIRSAIIALNATGTFVVAWDSVPCNINGSPQNCTESARLFDNTGKPKSNQFNIHPSSGRSTVAMDADGDFVQSWVERYNYHIGDNYYYFGDNFGHSVYNTEGKLMTEGIHRAVNLLRGGYYTVYDQVAIDDDGDYAVLSRYLGQYAGDRVEDVSFGLYRRFTDTPLGSKVLTKSLDDFSFYEFNPTDGALSMDGKGHIAALWANRVGSPYSDVPRGLFFQRFTGPSGESCHGAGATLVGSNGADTLFGTDKDDVIQGKDGDDVIHGRGGNDILCGGRGKDKLYGDAGKDFVEGGPGQDLCVAESTNNCP